MVHLSECRVIADPECGICNCELQPAMTDHAQRARELWEKIADEMVLAKRAGMTNVELARYTDRRAIELIAFDRAEAHAAGRRAGLEERKTTR